MDASGWDARYAERDLVWTADPNRFIASELTQLPPARAIDLGAGEGRNALWLAERGWDVTAVDFSREGLDKGARIASDRGLHVAWVLADLASWTWPHEVFDLVLVAYLHPGMEVVVALLSEAVGHLAPGGTVLVVGHDRDNLERGHGGPSDPAVLYTVGALTAALDGLRVDRAEQVEREVDTDPPAVAIDTLVRAARPHA
ncbi:MAG: class I SAM-dependent methyltransferase [Euzebyales bacterium]|nr:class I SAM-dependent methyltransferase [Euzebyales bacterium]